jgi:hypothetical protein
LLIQLALTLAALIQFALTLAALTQLLLNSVIAKDV